jgi:hypothetical protein
MRDDCVIDPVRPKLCANVSRKGLKLEVILMPKWKMAFEIRPGHLDA